MSTGFMQTRRLNILYNLIIVKIGFIFLLRLKHHDIRRKEMKQEVI